MLEVLHWREKLDGIPVKALQEAAGRYLDGKNEIRYALLPER